MKAIRFDGGLRFDAGATIPRRDGEALVRVICAGVCNTDLEIVKGYSGFKGILGHEFVGRVVESRQEGLIGRRVVGEINAGCNSCAVCSSGDSRHCPTRTVLGIKARDGAFAEYLSLPERNLIEVPDSISDEQAAFVEPLAAANHAVEESGISASSRVCVIGDGKLAQLLVRVLALTGCELWVIGKHQWKLNLTSALGARCVRLDGDTDRAIAEASAGRFDVVIEASGNPSGLRMALEVVRPQGTVVLKSTHHADASMDLSRVVVNEIKIVGSRCGRFSPALALLTRGVIEVRDLITHRIPIENGLQAFTRAASPDSLKVLLLMTGAPEG